MAPRVFKQLREKRGYPEKILTVGDQIKTERLDRGLRQKDVLRLKVGLTQRAAAELLGVHRCKRSDYENMKGWKKYRENRIQLAREIFEIIMSHVSSYKLCFS